MSTILSMLPAIQFNHQPRPEADKIRNIAANRFLPAKLVSGKTLGAQLLPQLLLLWRLLYAQFASTIGNPVP